MSFFVGVCFPGVFFTGFGLSATLEGLEAALDPEPLRSLAGVPAFEPSLGGALLTAGEDMVVSFFE